MDFSQVKLFGKKNFSDLLKEIHVNQKDKEVQLRHMMKLNTKTELFTMCEDVGFEVHTFWQNYNFLGFICLKK